MIALAYEREGEARVLASRQLTASTLTRWARMFNAYPGLLGVTTARVVQV